MEINTAITIILFILSIVLSLVAAVYASLKSKDKENKVDIVKLNDQVLSLKENIATKEDFRNYREDLQKDNHEFKVHVKSTMTKVEKDLRYDIRDLKETMTKIYEHLIHGKT